VTVNKTYVAPPPAPPPPCVDAERAAVDGSCPPPPPPTPPEMVERVTPSITKNGQNYALRPLNFTYYPHPAIVVYDPPGGQLGGNTTVTLFGTFPGGSEYVCRFGTTLVPATYSGARAAGVDEELVCSSPNMTAMDLTRGANNGRAVELRVSLNNQQFELAGPFTFYDEPIFESMVPLAGPTEGGTRVVIRSGVGQLAAHPQPGYDDQHQYFCRGKNPKVPSRLLRSSIPGLAPPQPTGAAHLTPHLLLYNSTHTRPRPLARVEQVPGSYLGGDELVCVTPPLTRGGTAVQVLLPLSSGGSGRPCRC